MSNASDNAKKFIQNMRRKKKYPVAKLGERLGRRLSVYAGWFVLAIFAIHPLMIRLDTGYTNITETKGATFIVLLLCSVFLMICAVTYALMLGHTPGLRLKERLRALRPYELALLGYWVVALLSACTSDDLKTAFLGASLRNEGFWFQTAYIAAFFVAARWYKPKMRDFVVMTSVAALICVYSVIQYYGNDFLHFYPNELPERAKIYYFGSMSNVNVASTYFCTVFLIGSALFAQHENRKLRWFLLPCLWLIFYVLLLGDTESGYVGLIAALAVGFPFVAKDRKSFARTLLLLAGCALMAYVNMLAFRAYHLYEPQFAVLEPYLPILAGVLAAAAALVFFLPIKRELPKTAWRVGWLALVVIVMVAGVISLPTLAEKTGNLTLEQMSSMLSGDIDDEYGSGRIIAWRRALEMVPEHPILGHGPDNFGRVYLERYTYPEYQILYEAAQARGEELTREEMPATFDKAHNEYIQTLVDEGILGLAAMLAFYGLLVFFAIRRHMDNPLAVGLTAALGCFVVQAIFNFSTPFAHPVTWTCWGILAAVMRDTPDNSRPAAIPAAAQAAPAGAATAKKGRKR